MSSTTLSPAASQPWHSQKQVALLSRQIQFHPARLPDKAEVHLKAKVIRIKVGGGTTVANGKFKERKDGLHSSGDVAKAEKEESPSLFPRNHLLRLLAWKGINNIGSGLSNLGNTCFMNASLQCLTYLPVMVNLSQERVHSKSCTATEFCAFCSMEQHVRRCLTSHGKVVAPNKFASNLKRINRRLRLGRQEDAHEFLQNLKDRMLKASLRGLDATKLNPDILRTSIIHQIFGGQLVSQVTCGLCHYISKTFDPFLDLSLEMTGCKSVQVALARFCHPEYLDDDNKYKCSNCRKFSKAKKQLLLQQCPPVLTIQLKRFNIFGGKINKNIEVNERLSVGKYIKKQKSQTEQLENSEYDLCGVLVHWGGSTNSGHYYCYVKNSNKIWYRMDDSSVRQVGLQTVLQDSAYILFYTSRNPPRVKSTQQTLQSTGTKSFANTGSAGKGRNGVEEKETKAEREANVDTEKKQKNKFKDSDGRPILPGKASALPGKVQVGDGSSARGETAKEQMGMSMKRMRTTSENDNYGVEKKQKMGKAPVELKWDDSLNMSAQWLEFKEKVEESKQDKMGDWEGKRRKRRKLDSDVAKDDEGEAMWKKHVHKELSTRKNTQFGGDVDKWEEGKAAVKNTAIQREILKNDDSLNPELVFKKRDRYEFEYDLGKQKKVKTKSEVFKTKQTKSPFERVLARKRKRSEEEKSGEGGKASDSSWKGKNKKQFKRHGVKGRKKTNRFR